MSIYLNFFRFSDNQSQIFARLYSMHFGRPFLSTIYIYNRFRPLTNVTHSQRSLFWDLTYIIIWCWHFLSLILSQHNDTCRQVVKVTFALHFFTLFSMIKTYENTCLKMHNILFRKSHNARLTQLCAQHTTEYKREGEREREILRARICRGDPRRTHTHTEYTLTHIKSHTNTKIPTQNHTQVCI